MSDQEILDKLQGVIRSVLDCEDVVLTEKTRFQDLGVSSFGLIQLICAIEDEFDIEIPNKAIKSINSVPAAVKFLKKLVK